MNTRAKQPTSTTEAIDQAFARYADRGVFAGFSRRRARSGFEYRFTWLTRQPMVVRFDPGRSTLTFANMLPAIEATDSLGREIKRLVADRATLAVPAHRRIRPGRARVACFIRRGMLSVQLSLKRPDADYAVQRGLNLINDVFLLLHESHPCYLYEHFGLSAE